MLHIPIWLDCDPGNDDAIALLLAVKCPRFHLLGVSTVFGNAPLEMTTRNACGILDLLGDSLTLVYSGSSRPLKISPHYATNIHGESGIGGIELPPIKLKHRVKQDNSFIDALEAAIEKYPYKICLVCTGALTNIARIIQQKPQLLNNVRWILVMGGAFGLGNVTPHAEFNIYADPHAADLVFKLYPQKILLAPLNLTHQVIATVDVINFIKAQGELGLEFASILLFYAQLYKLKGFLEGPAVHDPVTLIFILEMWDGCFHFGLEFDRRNVEVITSGESIGKTIDCGMDAQHGLRIGLKISPVQFWNHVIQVLMPSVSNDLTDSEK